MNELHEEDAHFKVAMLLWTQRDASAELQSQTCHPLQKPQTCCISFLIASVVPKLMFGPTRRRWRGRVLPDPYHARRSLHNQERTKTPSVTRSHARASQALAVTRMSIMERLNALPGNGLIFAHPTLSHMHRLVCGLGKGLRISRREWMARDGHHQLPTT